MKKRIFLSAIALTMVCSLFAQKQPAESNPQQPIDVKGNTAFAAPRFAVISDVHFGNNKGEGPMVKVPKALKNLIAKQPRVDAVFVVGDISDYGQSHQYDMVLKVFNDTTIVPADLPVFFLMGNHDHYSGKKAYENYFKLGQPLHHYIDIKGYPFITISMSGTSSNSYSDKDLDFLAKSMEDAAKRYPGKPIFVFTHVPPQNTVYGTQPRDGGWGSVKFEPILSKYPQAVVFSGHSHFPLGDPRSIHQNIYTSVNDGSTTYSEVEPGVVNEGIHPAKYDYVTEGVIVNVDANTNIEMERWDTYNDEEILPRWYVQAPHDGTRFLYKNRTGGAAPFFRPGAAVEIDNIKEEGCTVIFPQATDDEVVHHYRIEILKDGETVVTNNKFSGFYLNSKMPLHLDVRFQGVPNGSKLKARVTAIDSYDNESTSIESPEFVTEVYKPAAKTKKPKADLFDIQFSANGKAKDISPLHVAVETGNTVPTTYKEGTYNRWTARFPGSGQSYYKIDYSRNEKLKDAFRNGYTLELFYKPNTTRNMCPLSAQESGGTGIEQANGGLITFFAHVGGGYKELKSAVTTSPGKFYHVVAVYDKTAGETRIYVNGSPAGVRKAEGKFGFPGNEKAQWIGIGGDANGSETAQFALDGEVMIARMYSKPVSRDEVFWMHKEVTRQK